MLSEISMEDKILSATGEALRSVSEERFFRTERGYHGRFYCVLQSELDRRGLLHGGAILEMEYQKSAPHNTRQRPDIVFHVPTEYSGAEVRQNNFAVFALKRRATARDAEDDFRRLDEMCERLDYPLAIFINVDSEQTFDSQYRGLFRERLHTFSVLLIDGEVQVRNGRT
jgi:hypothetical protein